LPCYHRIPAVVEVLAGRLESVLELLGKLLGVVQLQASMVLPLLRTALQILTVKDLHLLQIKAVGARARGHCMIPCSPDTCIILEREF